MPPNRTQPHDYYGISRIQQACKNCRKYNSKSSGNRPIYISNNTENSAGSDIDRETSVNNDGLLERVGKIESQLDKLANTLNALLPAIVSQANSDQSVTSWRSDPHNAGIRDELASPARTTMDTSDVQASKYQALPPPQVMSSVVDIYFNRVQNQPYSFFHENNFRQRLRDDMLPDHLKFAVLATALRFSDDEYYNGEYLEATAAYARKSWMLLVEHWFAAEIDPDIYICQSVTLLAIIDFTESMHVRSQGYWKKPKAQVAILFLNDADSNIRQQAINGLQTNTTFLEELSRHWKNGKVMASLLQDLATESISSALLAASAAQPENLDAKILRNLWASVDTTTLSQPLKPITSSIGCDTPSTGFNSLLELDARDLSNFDINGLSPDPVSHLDMQSPNPSLALDGMSPFTSFFTGGSMNFGG
ncbi:hypothetical protein VE03_08897 [Pseudogymnoascus sp. 23342-1-I1]|nr:hypothetical protein VE03_08897 [Pseudogymnoascus sp. 23342-1-I1]